jgi:succinate-semialdehyde dehydrogenase/glutarate-semialdehyde dehydrogenase
VSTPYEDLSLYIDGEFVQGGGRREQDVFDPATGGLIGRLPHATSADLDRALAAAQRAFETWKTVSPLERSRILRRVGELTRERTQAIARNITLDQGKPLAEAVSELTRCADHCDWHAEECRRIYGRVIPARFPNVRQFVLREPIGVCAAITPWNVPIAMITRKVGPALATGCTMVVKPAEQTPFSALALAVLGQEAGIPAGVLSVVTGTGSEIGPVVTASPVVRKLSFTGSTEVGRLLMQQCAPTLKRLSLELGGNAPFLVFDDADLDAAVEGLLASKFRNTGQTCVCANRVLVQSAVHDAFAEKLTAAVKKLSVGDGLADGVQQGPLINEAAAAHVEALVADALAHGARLVTGGRRHALGGTFFEPTVLVGATPAMRLAQTEIFGPLAPLVRFETEAEGVALANATEHGLAAYFYARDSARIWRVAESLVCGMIGVNTGLISSETVPFGGVKQSGFGREGSFCGVDEYLELKSLTLAEV